MRISDWSSDVCSSDLKREKLAQADWLVTCTAFGAAHLRALAGRAGHVHLLYHGLDLDRFGEAAPGRSDRNGGDPGAPVRLLSVGRAVEKKGYDLLLAALAALPEGLHWRFTHIGGGPLRPALERQGAALGLAGRIDWRGAEDQVTVRAHYRQADLFVLASRIARDGDRDGQIGRAHV